MTTSSPFRVPAAPRQPVPPPRRWSAGRLGFALALFAIVAFVIAAVVRQAGSKTEVLVLARRVVQSQEITRADLRTTDVSGDFSAIPANQLDKILGRRAAYTMEAGVLLQPSEVTSQTGADAGQSSVGITVPKGLVPAGIETGDTVRVLQIPEHDGAAQDDQSAGLPSGSVLADGALITGLTEDTASTGNLVVTLRVPTDASGPLLVASSWGQIGLVQVGKP